ncbi:hypothetical protein ACLB2K_025278 [Fragaria x ananassa]
MNLEEGLSDPVRQPTYSTPSSPSTPSEETSIDHTLENSCERIWIPRESLDELRRIALSLEAKLLRRSNKEDPQMGDVNEEESRPMKEYTLPTISNHPSCIVLPPYAVAFEIKPGTIANLPLFFGLPNNESYLHLQEFNEACSTVQLLGIDEGNLRLRLFPFSLKDRAKKWLYKLPPRSINTWEEMQKVFLKFYFPPHTFFILLLQTCSWLKLEANIDLDM